MTVRRNAYTMARALGDWNALASGKPSKVAKRAANKWIGRNLVRRLWLR